MPEEILETTQETEQAEKDPVAATEDRSEAGDTREAVPNAGEEASDLPPGMNGEGLRRFLRARHAREIGADMRMREHFMNLNRQAEALREKYPDFDLAREMADPVFARLTAPGVDIDAATAYEVIHGRDLRSRERREDALRIARAVASGSLRPHENALTGSQAGAPVRTDPRTLSPGMRRDIRRRVEKGERVTF